MGKRILLIEDEVDLCRLMEARLRAIGGEIQVDFVHDGDQALKKIFEIFPDVIILDIMLPYVNGQEVLRLIRKNPRTAKIPVIVITALPTMLTRDILMKLGANDFLEKPVDSAVLNHVISAYLN